MHLCRVQMAEHTYTAAERAASRGDRQPAAWTSSPTATLLLAPLCPSANCKGLAGLAENARVHRHPFAIAIPVTTQSRNHTGVSGEGAT